MKVENWWTLNGFASEKEYDAVSKLVVGKIDEYTETIRIEKKDNGIETYIIVEIETATAGYYTRYFVGKKGVWYVNTEHNMTSEQCKVFAGLNEIAESIFAFVEYE